VTKCRFCIAQLVTKKPYLFLPNQLSRSFSSVIDKSSVNNVSATVTKKIMPALIQRINTADEDAHTSCVPQHTNEEDDQQAYHHTVINDECEATELGQLNSVAIERHQHPETSLSSVSGRQDLGRFDGVRRWWKHYIQLQVPHAECRDHLGELEHKRQELPGLRMGFVDIVGAANERTFLAYQRTSLALCMMGIVIAQLFSLQHSPEKAAFGYHALGKPLAAVFESAAIVVIMIGGHRFWRQQMNMARGKVWAGGWEVWVIMVFMLVVSNLPVSFCSSFSLLRLFFLLVLTLAYAASRVCFWAFDRGGRVGVKLFRGHTCAKHRVYLIVHV
jgi:uncharacterized membrane protein YidH (DUF202 family)